MHIVLTESDTVRGSSFLSKTATLIESAQERGVVAIKCGCHVIRNEQKEGRHLFSALAIVANRLVSQTSATTHHSYHRTSYQEQSAYRQQASEQLQILYHTRISTMV